MADQKIIAVGLLTQDDVDRLGSTFQRIWPVQDAPCFSQLLRAIDQADRELREEHSSSVNNRRIRIQGIVPNDP